MIASLVWAVAFVAAPTGSPQESTAREEHGKLSLPLGGSRANRRVEDPSTLPAAPQPRTATSALAFVENLGQWDSPAAFVAMSGPAFLRVLPDGFVVDVELAAGTTECEGPSWAHLGFALEGMRADAAPQGASPQPGRRDYLRGPAEDWVLGARTFAEVVWTGVAEGVDLRLRDGGGLPEYDLLLAPGADLASVVVRCDGARGVALDDRGGLSVDTEAGVLRQSPPATWCVLPDGGTRAIECAFVVLDDERYGFRLSEHDPELSVVVDPGLEWASYLDGSGRDFLWELDLGPSGELAMCGETRSVDFATTGGPPLLGPLDAWVAIADPSGSTLLHSVYVGGDGEDYGTDVEVGADGRVYLTGITSSANLPTTAGAWSTTLGGNWDGFVLELSPSGTLPAVTYSTTYASYVGGGAYDGVGSLQLDGARTVVLAGVTASLDLPTTAGALQPTYAGGTTDYFLYRMVLGDASTPTVLSHGTYLGGSDYDGRWNIAGVSGQRLKEPQLHQSADGTWTLAGRTFSADIVRSATAWDTVINTTGTEGQEDGYVAVMDGDLSSVLWDTYAGGALGDAARSVVREASGVVTVGGFTDSEDFPTTTGAFDTTFVGAAPAHDGWILRFDPGLPPAEQLLYGTLLGGDGYENVLGLAVDSQGRILAGGYTGPNPVVPFPTTPDAFLTGDAGGQDGYLVYLDPAGQGTQDLLYGTILGGPLNDAVHFELRLLDEGSTVRVLAAAQSGQGGFPAPDAWGWDSTPGTLENGFVLRFSFEGATETPRAGTPPNPIAFLAGVTSGPVLGKTWDPVVDHTTFLPGAVTDLLLISSGAWNLPLGPPGTLLIDVTHVLGTATAAPGTPFAVPIPWKPILFGVNLSAQAAGLEASGNVLLTNALDLELGSF